MVQMCGETHPSVKLSAANALEGGAANVAPDLAAILLIFDLGCVIMVLQKDLCTFKTCFKVYNSATLCIPQISLSIRGICTPFTSDAGEP